MSTLHQHFSALGTSLPSVRERASIYERMGLGPASEYRGTAAQNAALLAKLQHTDTPPSPSQKPVPLQPAPLAPGQIVAQCPASGTKNPDPVLESIKRGKGALGDIETVLHSARTFDGARLTALHHKVSAVNFRSANALGKAAGTAANKGLARNVKSVPGAAGKWLGGAGYLLKGVDLVARNKDQFSQGAAGYANLAARATHVLGTAVVSKKAGLIGAKGGAVAGAKTGAMIGMIGGPKGMALGAAIGGAVGAVGGFMATSKASDKAINKVFNEDQAGALGTSAHGKTRSMTSKFRSRK